jgi:hypothetical protein
MLICPLVKPKLRAFDALCVGISGYVITLVQSFYGTFEAISIQLKADKCLRGAKVKMCNVKGGVTLGS